MSGYNLADLERQMIDDGWTVSAEDFVAKHSIPGQVFAGGYSVALTSPEGVTFTGDGTDRSEAFRAAAARARLLPPEGELI
jgi:hypothetical protein